MHTGYVILTFHELLLISQGKLLIELNTNNETLQENKKWVAGDGLNAYRPLFVDSFPCAESVRESRKKFRGCDRHQKESECVRGRAERE